MCVIRCLSLLVKCVLFVDRVDVSLLVGCQFVGLSCLYVVRVCCWFLVVVRCLLVVAWLLLGCGLLFGCGLVVFVIGSSLLVVCGWCLRVACCLLVVVLLCHVRFCCLLVVGS